MGDISDKDNEPFHEKIKEIENCCKKTFNEQMMAVFVCSHKRKAIHSTS